MDLLSECRTRITIAARTARSRKSDIQKRINTMMHIGNSKTVADVHRYGDDTEEIHHSMLPSIVACVGITTTAELCCMHPSLLGSNERNTNQNKLLPTPSSEGSSQYMTGMASSN